jgi:2-oxoisovalerate dehydrogenase E1 component
MKQFIDKGIGYGIEAVQVDGNNIIETYSVIKSLAESIRKKPRPVLLECLTFRMRGHEEASGTKYVPPELFEEWGRKDPVNNFENYLLQKKIIDEGVIASLRKEMKLEIEKNLEITFAEENPVPDSEKELKDIFDQTPPPVFFPSANLASGEQVKKSDKRYLDAITDGMRQAMQRHENLVIMGQDIAEYGGVFKATQGFVEEFGKARVRNTPICESAIIGAGFGLSINGMKSIVEMQFADFVTCGFNQVINNLAKSHYRWGQHADVVVRMPTGAGVNAGPFHSQSNEAWFVHTPGLKVVYPAFPSDAKGLLIAAIEDPNPVMFFEHKALYRSVSEEVADEYYSTEIGKARLVREGDDVTIVTYGFGVHWAMETLDQNQQISADLIDLRTLLPWDKECVENSVRKTGKLIILHEDTLTGGIGGEIAAYVSEHCFDSLDAPVVRCASLDTPVPMNVELEMNFLPKKRFPDQLMKLLAY